MTEGYVLAIDQGTTGTIALVFDRDARIRGRAYAEFAQTYPQPGGGQIRTANDNCSEPFQSK